MSQPNVVEALRNVLDAWPKGAAFCEPGSTLHRLHEAAAALPSGPCVVVPVELVIKARSWLREYEYDAIKYGAAPDSIMVCNIYQVHIQLTALLTAQMPQKDTP